MRKIFTTATLALTLAACANSTLYPTAADLSRSCPEVVQDSYTALATYKRKSSLSTLTTVSAAGLSCVVITGGLCILVAPLAFSLDIALDPFNKAGASNTFSKNMEQGRAMSCSEN